MNLKEYHPDWRDIIRPNILKRDGYRCKVCGVQHKARVYKLTRAGYHVCDQFTEAWAKANDKRVFTLHLVVAHIDQNKQNNDPSNLMTLCPFHHAKFDAKHKALKRKIKLAATDFSHPPAIPEYIADHSSHLREICNQVRELTGCTITRTEAESLYQLTLNFLQNVKN